MTKVAIIDLPYPPSVNTYYRMWRNRMVLSKKGKEFKTKVALAWILSGRPCFGEERVELLITLHPPDRRRRDADNTIKAIQDSLQSCGCFVNDCQVRKLTVLMDEPCPPEGKAFVVIGTYYKTETE